MIPVRLTVKNFLSYGEQVPTLDFSSLHVVCLSGQNGHGKSALLDAITWAVWGEARKAAGDRKPDEGLLRIGATEMAVEFEFDLEDDRYRILRQYQRTGRSGKSTLEFQIYNRETGEYRSGTDTTITRTQQRIIDTLRMDYPTFINSVFLLQGRADEFTKRNARERKKILADILGLSRYDELMERARRCAQEAAKRREDDTRRLRQIEEALQGRETCLNSIEELHGTIDGAASQLRETDQALEELQERRAEVAGAARQLKELDAQSERLRNDGDTLAERVARQRTTVKEYQAALAERDRIERAFQEYRAFQEERDGLARNLQTLRRHEQRRTEIERCIESARHEVEKGRQGVKARIESIERTLEETKEVLAHRARIEKGYRDLEWSRRMDEEWEEKRRRHDEIERRIETHREALVKAETDLQSELGGYRYRLADLQAKADALAECKERAAARRRRVDALVELERRQQEIAERGRTLNAHIETFEDKMKLYAREDEEAQGKLKMLRRGTAAHCPLCEAALDDRRRQAIEVNLGESIKGRAREMQRLQEGVRAARVEKNTLTLRYKENRPELDQLSGARQALAEAEARVREASAAAGEIGALRQNIQELQTRLARRQFAPGIQQTVAALRQEQAELGYDTERHRAIKDELRALQPFEGEKAQLEAAIGRHEKAQVALPAQRAQLASLNDQLEKRAYAPEEQAQLQAILEKIRRVAYDEARYKEVEDALLQRRDAPERHDRLTQAIRQCDAARETLNDLESRVQQLRKERAALTERSEALNECIRQAGDVEQRILARSRERAELQKILDEANRRLGAAERQAEQYRALEAERPVVEEQRRVAARDAQIYEKLTVAFGKDGIQALIIENTLPEIEEEANRILSRLTGNRTQITIEPLRDLKTGGTKETLDIKISDELGTRSYELFSGGEAFRTNFAIRIALSKLLAHRAGTRLRTLVIDEGFGTQDAQGLEHLIEALQEIQEDFEKIIVVTHLEQLKNVFPARVEVTKYPDIGSRFEVFT